MYYNDRNIETAVNSSRDQTHLETFLTLLLLSFEENVCILLFSKPNVHVKIPDHKKIKMEHLYWVT